jgi:hypothetical protein
LQAIKGTFLEQLSARLKQVLKGDEKGNLLSGQSALLTEDLAAFLVSHYVLVTGVDSVAAVRANFQPVPEVFEIVDGLLAQMEEKGLLSIFGDKIHVAQRFADIGGNVDNLRRFLPQLLRLSSERVLTDADEGMLGPKREGLRYFVIPDDEESSIEAQAIFMDFKLKMMNLAARVAKDERKSSGVRLVAALNCSLEAEDFR